MSGLRVDARASIWDGLPPCMIYLPHIRLHVVLDDKRVSHQILLPRDAVKNGNLPVKELSDLITQSITSIKVMGEVPLTPEMELSIKKECAIAIGLVPELHRAIRT